jgi:hypothetical protein
MLPILIYVNGGQFSHEFASISSHRKLPSSLIFQRTDRNFLEAMHMILCTRITTRYESILKRQLACWKDE